MAQARSSLGLTYHVSIVPEQCPVSKPLFKSEPDTTGFTLLGSSINGQEHGEPSTLGSKGARDSKILCLKVNSSGISKNYIGKRVNLELNLQSLLRKEKASPSLSISSSHIMKRAQYGNQAIKIYNSPPLPRAHAYALEEMAGQDLMRAAQETHYQQSLEAMVAQLKREKEAMEKRVQALEHQVSSLNGRNRDTEVAFLKSRVEIQALEQRCIDCFNVGRAAGRLELARDWQVMMMRSGFIHHHMNKNIGC